MVAKGYGKADKDTRHKGTKEISDKPMPKPTLKVSTTGMIGGIGNNKSGSEKKKGAR